MRRKWILPVVAVAIVLALAMVIAVTRRSMADEERTLASLRRVDDFPLYVMRYYGGYGFNESLQERTGRYPAGDLALSSAEWACTCFAGLSLQGNMVFGRNFDWTTQAALLLFTAPPDGYASVSMVDITYLGFDEAAPDADQRRRLLQAPFMPFDGLNDQGLAVGMMAVDGQAPQDPHKATISSLEAIRLVLDYARDVDEALALLERYNVSFGQGPPVHYLIADAMGDAVVVEYVRGELRVIRNEQPWHVATNFLLSEIDPQDGESPCRRYNAAWRVLEQSRGCLEAGRAMGILEDVSQVGDSGTRWSVVYDMDSGDVHVSMGRCYDEIRRFRLEMAH